jgi:exodeoxyribonuclease V alpha subunit
MVDAFLFAALVKAIKGGSHLVLIGDRDQLPSVGPGNVIRDLMASGFLPMTVLSHNFRQEDSASLNGMAELICQGQDERFMRSMEDSPQQFLFHLSESEEEAQRFVLEEMECLLERTGISSLDYQVLSPMYRGAAGVEELNRLIQARFNQRELLLELPGRSFRLGDRVMQLRNNYQLEIFNGEQGIVKGYDGQRRLLKVEFADRQVELSRDQMEELVLSYATTVHKAQGAEFQEVILCLLTSHGVMLNRELFYTAMTRARRRVVLVGNQRAVHLAIRQAMPRFRKTLLPERLREGFAHIHPKLDEGCGHASKK